MSNATEYALEQADRIVQYAKYSDRFLIVEDDYAAERRAFVKLVCQKLPPQVRPVVVRASGDTDLSTVIEHLSSTLQLSAGIETPEQLVTATTAALEDSDRLLLVIENAEHWLDSGAAASLYELIDQAHDLARERILFMLVGNTGLCTRLETAQPMATIIADIHCVQLPGIAAVSDRSADFSPAGTRPGEPLAPQGQATAGAPFPASGRRPAGSPGGASARRGGTLWTYPPFMIAAAVSVAVITIGVFALLSRSSPPSSPDEMTLALEREAEGSDTGEETPGSAGDTTDDGDREDARATEANGEPLHVPFPEGGEQPARQGSDTARTTPADGIASPTEPPQANESDGSPSPADQPETGEADEPASAEERPEADAGEATSSGEETETTAAGDEPAPDEPAGETTADSGVDNAWYREQPRARAAIQLAAFGSLDGAREMIRTRSGDAHPAEKWHIYTQRVDDRTLYTVTYGDFASVERARHAIDSLPEELRAIDPYPRSVGDIQDRIAD